MLTENLLQKKTTLDLTALPVAIEPIQNYDVEDLVAKLNPGTPWGERRIAAQKLGNLRDQRAVPALLNALPGDNFWMVRCAIIQTLEKIGDLEAIPVLQEVETNDTFQVVRAYARTAIERIACK